MRRLEHWRYVYHSLRNPGLEHMQEWLKSGQRICYIETSFKRYTFWAATLKFQRHSSSHITYVVVAVSFVGGGTYATMGTFVPLFPNNGTHCCTRQFHCFLTMGDSCEQQTGQPWSAHKVLADVREWMTPNILECRNTDGHPGERKKYAAVSFANRNRLNSIRDD